MSGLSVKLFEELWTRIDAEAQARKDSQAALSRLTEHYQRLDEEDKSVANVVLVRWVTEGNTRQRYDALALIREFEIRSALPALRENLASLAQATGPSVPFDREKLEQIIAGLE